MSRCIDPPFDRSNGSRLLFCLNKARQEHGHNRKLQIVRSRRVDADLARHSPELGCKRPQLFHERLAATISMAGLGETGVSRPDPTKCKIMTIQEDAAAARVLLLS
jgi:hypothetical protein